MTLKRATFLAFVSALGACSSPVSSSLPSEEETAEESLSTPDWSREATLPAEGHRTNVYGLPEADLRGAIARGQRHALWYPVEITGMLVPIEPFERLYASDDIFTRMFGEVWGAVSGFEKVDDIYSWLGLYQYPAANGRDGIHYPRPGGRPHYRMGVALHERGGAIGLTYGCAACHVGQLFGRKVFGMTTRFSRANDSFYYGKMGLPSLPKELFRLATNATNAEMRMLDETTKRLAWVGGRMPQARGLDTSLAQVGLSLARRELDPYASMTARSAASPRRNMLESHVADSKPAVWWNVKYKTRWLSDGSVVSGNPVHTNFLWNEIGRATDLRRLEAWLGDNDEVIRDLTAAVFATKAPRYTDFFGADAIDLQVARRGQSHFNDHCARCHGTYDKAWDAGRDDLSAAEMLATVRVSYHERTPVVDVGTDPGRYQGTTGFAGRLNELAISQTMGTVIETQVGYVPPPLVGIWARWPYFHNNAAPTLCAVLTRSTSRPRSYVAGEPVNPATDFDRRCNGYPSGDAVPRAWRRDPAYTFDSSKQGLSVRGHDEGVFLREGVELMSNQEKLEVIEFLKTL